MSRGGLCQLLQPTALGSHQTLIFLKPPKSSQSNNKDFLTDAAAIEQKIRARALGRWVFRLGSDTK